MFDSILIVCIGNICRSPTGERLMRASLPGKKIDSAGLGALVGEGANPMAAEVAAEHGVCLDGHCAQAFSSSLAMQYDLILVMENSHLERIKKSYPEVSGKTMLFGHWQNQLEIGDPYKKSREMYQLVYTQLAQSTARWVLALKK
ncbi:protein tyrosine phosphatase [Buttiauxella sp. B2]|uniref:arsenate reductase/protein-tyrosine-phosphatase family protein n=1 Tax=Buttiauxella sp. B2 TaxID=2587812 RepID=UPI00111D24A0|nr:protein tyrosine phosphatase [Buttiauxella sp. B2]TNV21253.1 protein tyrosine phosphatase [Buttiauxella sp. B2]